jgi:uncharacterized protein (DUF433 family)
MSDSHVDWSGCDLVEVIPGNVSGVPLLVATRIPVTDILNSYQGFLEEGNNSERAIIETLYCYPGAGEKRIRGNFAYYCAHEAQLQR